MKPVEWAQRVPWAIVGIAVALILLGWLGIARCDELFGDSHLKRQIVFSVVAVAGMLVVSIPNYRVLGRYSYAIFLASLVLLVVVYFFPDRNGSHRWILLGPVSIQPSEFAKVAFVLALARYLMYRENYRRFRGLFVPLMITMLPVVLILREPDLGTASVFLPLLFVMLFVAGAKRLDLAMIIATGILMLPLLWTQMSAEQKSRVTALFDQPAPGETLTDDSRHLYQAKRMRAMGGLWGSVAAGPLTDDTGAYRLPAAPSDFVFSVLGERLGLWGTALVLVLYGMLVWQAAAIAWTTREPFGRLVAAGIATLFGIELIINTAMGVGLLPITGLSLPLVSYGGSGLLAHGIALGLLLNIGMRPGYEVTKEPFRYKAE